MTKEKTMEELLEKVNISKLKEVGVNPQEIAKVEALHDLLKQGKTWKDQEVKDLFRVLPDSFRYCTAFVHNEVLIRIGKCKPIKIVPRPGIKDSRLKWVPVEKSEEFNVPPTIPIKGYEIICAQCHQVFIGKESFHQSFCSKCANRKTPDIDIIPDPKPEKIKPVKTEEKPKKRRGRPPKKDSEKTAQPKKTTKKTTTKKSEKTSVRPTKARKATRKRKK